MYRVEIKNNTGQWVQVSRWFDAENDAQNWALDLDHQLTRRVVADSVEFVDQT